MITHLRADEGLQVYVGLICEGAGGSVAGTEKDGLDVPFLFLLCHYHALSCNTIIIIIIYATNITTTTTLSPATPPIPLAAPETSSRHYPLQHHFSVATAITTQLVITHPHHQYHLRHQLKYGTQITFN